MKMLTNVMYIMLLVAVALAINSCSDEPKDNQQDDYRDFTIGFKNAPVDQFGSSAYGENLYNGEINRGYIANLNDDTYLQFPINFGYNYNQNFELNWCYTLYNGGLALSHYHDMTQANYLNQLSVYDTTSPSGGNFVVANGSSLSSDPDNATYSDYSGCAHIYFTDKNGYRNSDSGETPRLEGIAKEGYFNSVYINNTTYTYWTMKNGDAYCQPLNEENKGWFKVQFIAFENDDDNAKPLDYTEAYLANFNSNLARGYQGIIDEWIKVDLSPLPQCSILVINFVGSDSGEWGLNTPAYCALDNFEVKVKVPSN